MFKMSSNDLDLERLLPLTDDRMDEICPELANIPNHYTEGGEDYQRRTERNGLYFKDFIQRFYPSLIDRPPSIKQIVYFMAARCGVFDQDFAASEIEYFGKVSLLTFVYSDLQCLVKYLQREYGERFHLTPHNVRQHDLFKNAFRKLKEFLGDSVRSQAVHARVIWYSDEQRLISATSRCTMGLQMRAFLRVMLQTGARGKELGRINYYHDVKEKLDHHGKHVIEIRILNKKGQGDYHWCTIRGEEECDDVARWLKRRRVIFKQSEWLFITNIGQQIQAPKISMQLSTLAVAAGYGERFFTSHSGRQSYGCRRAAYHFSRGESTSRAVDELGKLGPWKYGSSAISRYIDPSVHKYFDHMHGEALTWDQFKELPPSQLHQMESGMSPVVRLDRVAFFFDMDLVTRVASWLGSALDCDNSQWDLLRYIWRRLYSRDSELRNWVAELHPEKSNLGRDDACQTIYSLFENEWIDVGFTFADLTVSKREKLKDDLLRDPLISSRVSEQPIVPSQKVLQIDIRDDDHERKLEKIYSKRPCERRTIIGQHPDGRRTLISSNRLNRNTDEVVRLRTLSIANTEAATPSRTLREERVPLLQRLESRMESRTNKNISTPSTSHTSHKGSTPATHIESPGHGVSRRLTFGDHNEAQSRRDDDNYASNGERLGINNSDNAFDRVGVPKKRRTLRDIMREHMTN